MTPARIDHIAVGVESTKAAAERLERTFRAHLLSGEGRPDARSLLVRLDGVCLELVQVPSSEFCGHIAVAVSDLDAATEKLQKAGVRFAGEVVQGAGGSRNRWLNAEDCGGLRIHLCERPQ